MKYKYYLLKKNYLSSSILENKAIIDLIHKSGRVTYYVFQLEHNTTKDTYRHQLFISYKNPIALTTVEKKFEEFIVKEVTVNPEKAADYCKIELNRVNSLIECGIPPQLEKISPFNKIYNMLKTDASNDTIREQFPSEYIRYSRNIDQVRQELKTEEYQEKFRNLEVTYIYGETNTGKTRSVFDKYGYKNVYRVTDFLHPFDTYKSQDVLVFEEFRSNFSLSEMLNYLDGYPLMLPARYYQKTACYTKVYIISNIPLEHQYLNIQHTNLESYRAFCRRIHKVQHFKSKPKASKNKVKITNYSSVKDYFKKNDLAFY